MTIQLLATCSQTGIQQPMPDFSQSFNLSKIASALWRTYLQNHYGKNVLDIISLEENIRYQKAKYGDFLVVLDDDKKESRYFTVETKIRDARIYDLYLRDNCILFEIMGNVERQNNGSSLFDSKADIWATAFLVNGQLKEPILFWVEPLKRFVKHWANSYRNITSDTNAGKYHTLCKLVPLPHLQQFVFRPLI